MPPKIDKAVQKEIDQLKARIERDDKGMADFAELVVGHSKTVKDLRLLIMTASSKVDRLAITVGQLERKVDALHGLDKKGVSDYINEAIKDLKK